MKRRVPLLCVIGYWLCMTAAAYGQVVVEAPAPVTTAPQVIVRVPPPVVQVPPVVIEQQPPAIRTQPSESQYQAPTTREVPVGTVFVSTNWDPRENRAPGRTNHLCIYVGGGWIVESQQGQGVKYTPWKEYKARPQNVQIVFPRSPELGEAAAARAKTFVGLPYWTLSSFVIFPRSPRCGMNCVSVVGEAYGIRHNRLRRPDHIFYCTEAFATRPPQ